MKVIWISHGSTLEGAERCLADAVKILANKEIEIQIILPSEGKLASILKNMGLSIHILPQPRWINEFKDTSSLFKRFYQYLKSIIKLTYLLRRLQGDIIITNTIVIPCGAIASKLLGITHIWYIHEFLEEDHGWSFEFGRKFSLKYIEWFSEIVIFNSQAVYERFTEDISANKARLIYHSVEMPEGYKACDIPNLEKGIFNIALVGRKAPGKGQKEAIEAIAILFKRNYNIHLSLVGGDFGGYTETLQELAQNLEVSEKVDFISFVDDPLSYMMAADVVLMCSKSEAFGRVTIEAMKLGKAVIGANSGSTPELIKDGWNGLLYQSGCPSSLAEKIDLLYNDKSLREQLGVNAYSWANQKFNSENYASDLLNVFNEALSQE